MKKSYDLLKVDNASLQKGAPGAQQSKVNQTFGMLMQSLDRAQRIIQIVKEQPQ